jgi:hypothetical protein
MKPFTYERARTPAEAVAAVARSRPLLRHTVRDVVAYDTVFLGFPIWVETTPPIIRSFLSSHDLSGM